MIWRIHRDDRAIALLIAMVVCFFLITLTGALIQTQSSAFAVTQSSDAHLRSRAACESVYDFCLYQLEHNRRWGATDFATPREVDPLRVNNAKTADLENRIAISEVDKRVFRGFLSDHEASFEVEVTNALTSPAGAVSRDGSKVPHETVRLTIKAWHGKPNEAEKAGGKQEVDCRLRLAPLYDASVLTRGDMSVAADEVIFSSKDPFRNEIRAEGNISLPGLTGGRTRFVKHNPDVIREGSKLDGMDYDHTGLLWSGDNIQQGGQTLVGDNLRDAAKAAGGRLVNKAKNRADIYDLKPENIPSPTTIPKDRDITVPPGEFRFTKAKATINYKEKVGRRWKSRVTSQNIDVVEYYDPPGSAQPIKVMRRDAAPPTQDRYRITKIKIDYGPGARPDTPVVIGDKFYVDNDKYQDTVAINDGFGNVEQVRESGFRAAKPGVSQGPVVIDLAAQSVTVAPQTRVRPAPRSAGSDLPPSSFELTVKQGTGGSPNRPTFVLGGADNDVVLEADGNISIGAGFTKGLGTIISKGGDVNLAPVPQELKWVQKYINGALIWVLDQAMDVDANSDYAGLVVYAGRDVKITNLNDADWTFKGFVYARRNFNFDVNKSNALFYGSVVAGNSESEPGQFQITNGKRAAFIYDPDYLRILTRQMPYGWTRVEPLVWAETNS